MRKYKIKNNNITKKVLPILLFSFIGLIVISFFVPETLLMDCSKVEQTLFENHNNMIIDMDDTTHLQYHEKLHDCMNNGYTSNLNT